jgi:AraC-like DNA-binding protein
MMDCPDTEQPDFISTRVTEARRFWLDLHPRQRKELTVVCGGWERCAPDYRIRRANFRFLSIEYVAQGEGALVLRGRRCRLVPGTVFTYGPRVAHDITTDASRRLLKYFVDFAGGAGERLMREVGLEPGTVTQVLVPNRVREIFDELIRSGLRQTRLAPRLCARLLEYLLLSIAEDAATPGAGGSQAFTTYLRCRQFIDEHFLQLRTLADAASQCHVDPAYLCRLFRRFDHRSPYQHLLRLKMGRAAELLQTPGRLVKQVADELQFSDPYHFSRAFKAVYGAAPERFVEVRRG